MVDRLKLRILSSRLFQKLFRRPVDIRESWAKTPGHITDMVLFLDWFDRTKSVEDTVKRARIDWKHRFAAMPWYPQLAKGTVLEIGFGGGRLLAQAAKEFRRAIGVDIHDAFAMTQRFLSSQGINNVHLARRDEIASLPDASVDFIYSFIVFQHFDTVDEVNFYFDQIERLLAPSGVAQVYYGKKDASAGIDVTSPDDFRLRDCSLFIAPETMRDLVATRFDLVDYKDELVRDPEAGTGKSVQAMVVFRRRAHAFA